MGESEINLSDMTDEKLEEALNSEEDEALENEETESEESTEDEGKNNQKETRGAESEEDKKTETNEDSKDDGFKPDMDKYEAITKDQKVIDELIKRDRQLWEKEKLIGKQSNEVHEARKAKERLEKIKEKLGDLDKTEKLSDEELDNLFLKSPTQAQKKLDEQRKFDEEKKKLLEEQSELQTKNFVYEKFPDFDNQVSSVEDILKADGFSDDDISKFKQNPFSTNGGLLYNFVKRAEAKTEVNALKTQLAEKEQEILALKQEAGDITKKIANGAKQKAVKSTTGTGDKGGLNYDLSMLHQMSDSKLDELLNASDEELGG